MMTNYRQSNNSLFGRERNSRLASFFVWLGLTLLILGLLLFSGSLREETANFLMAVAKPLWQTKNGGVNILEKENNRLALLEIENQALQEENKELREFFGLEDSPQGELSAVLFRPSQSPFDTFIIEGGEDSGFSPGDLIFGSGNVVLGRIVEVYNRTSKAVLFSSAGEETNVLLGEERVSLAARGRGGQNFEIKLPEGILVFPGELLILPGSSLAILAVVGEISFAPEETLKTIFARSPVNMQELRFVIVRKNTL